MKCNIIHVLWFLFLLGEKEEERSRTVFTVQMCVSSFQEYHALNLCSTSLSESCSFVALTQAAFLIAELETLSHLGIVSTMSVKSERGKAKPTAKPPFLERYDADPEITPSSQNAFATCNMVSTEEEWSSGIYTYSVIVVFPAAMICAC